MSKKELKELFEAIEKDGGAKVYEEMVEKRAFKEHEDYEELMEAMPIAFKIVDGLVDEFRKKQKQKNKNE